MIPVAYSGKRGEAVCADNRFTSGFGSELACFENGESFVCEFGVV